MGKKIISGALTEMDRILGMAGRGSSQTDLEDGSVTQVIDIKPVVRRSLSLPSTEGIFFCYLENDHAGADSERSFIDPYEPGAAAIPPYPPSVSRDFDFYVLQIFLRATGAGSLSNGMLMATPTAVMEGWGIDDSQLPVVTNFAAPLGVFDSVITIDGSIIGITADGESVININLRIRRGCILTFSSDSGGAVVFKMVLICALQPIGLGQDVTA